jgi:hypothetical protein
VPAAVERMRIPSSFGSCWIRTRSPSSDPPETFDDGSTASTATRCPCSMRCMPSASIVVDLPTPGTPVMPTCMA